LTKQELLKEYELIKRAQRDKNAFAPLYEKYFVFVFRFVYKRVGDKDLTNDLTSQTFVNAMMHIQKFEFRGVSLSPWLIRIAINEVNKHFRTARKQHHVSIDENQMAQLSDDVDLAHHHASMEQLVEALNELDDNDQQLIELRYFEQLSFKEMSVMYNASEAALKMKVYRLLDRMKKRLEQKRSSSS